MGETIDANPDAGARRKRIPTRVFVLSSMLLVVLLAGVGLAQCTDADDAAPDVSDTVPQSPEAETSESTGSAPTTLTQNVSDPIESSVPLGTVDPVGEPSTQDAATSATYFLDRIPVAINPTAIENTSGADSTTYVSTDISEIVTGAMADEVLATAAEFEAMGWTQSGTPEIVDVRVVRAPTISRASRRSRRGVSRQFWGADLERVRQGRPSAGHTRAVVEHLRSSTSRRERGWSPSAPSPTIRTVESRRRRRHHQASCPAPAFNEPVYPPGPSARGSPASFENDDDRIGRFFGSHRGRVELGPRGLRVARTANRCP